MHKIIIGALIAIITWEIGAQLATRFESKVALVASEVKSTPENKRAAPESQETAPESQGIVLKTPRAAEPEATVLVLPEHEMTEEFIEKSWMPMDISSDLMSQIHAAYQDEWPPQAEFTDHSNGEVYEPNTGSLWVQKCRIHQSLLWDDDGLYDRETKKYVPNEAFIYSRTLEWKFPPIFPKRSRCLQLQKDYAAVRKNAEAHYEVLKTENPWSGPWVELQPTGLFHYHVYDPVGYLDFNDKVQKIINERDTILNTRLPWNKDNKQHNRGPYYDTWWADYQFLCSLGMIWWDIEGMKQRIRDVPKERDFRAPSNIHANFEMPIEMETFVEKQEEVLDQQQKLVELLTSGSGGGGRVMTPN